MNSYGLKKYAVECISNNTKLKDISPCHAEIVETTFLFLKYGWIMVISGLFNFCILISFLVVPLNDRRFLELTFFSGAD